MSLSKSDLQSLAQVARQSAIAAGQYIQSQLNGHLIEKHKKGIDSIASQIVTQVDLKSQEIILSALQESIEKYDLGLLTEEASDDQSRAIKSHFWCVDPMDGTLPYTEGKTGYAVSIALIEQAGNPLIGVVYIPDLEECYWSLIGEGVWLNDRLLRLEQLEGRDSDLHVYMDRSLQTESYFEEAKAVLNQWGGQKGKQVKFHSGYGAVRNALAVLNTGVGCYFKFPKKRVGGGSIWDYAATRLFFEEMGLIVSDSYGDLLHLNNLDNSFMNGVGVIYATHSELSQLIKQLKSKVSQQLR